MPSSVSSRGGVNEHPAPSEDSCCQRTSARHISDLCFHVSHLSPNLPKHISFFLIRIRKEGSCAVFHVRGYFLNLKYIEITANRGLWLNRCDNHTDRTLFEKINKIKYRKLPLEDLIDEN